MWLLHVGGYADATVTAYAIAAEYPHSTLSGTLTCSSSAVSYYDTHLAGQEESGCAIYNTGKNNIN